MDVMNMIYILMLIIYITDAWPRCKEGWKLYDKRCYLFSRQISTWAGASYVCAELGGSLASLETKKESDFIEEQVYNNAYVGCFNDRNNPRLLPQFHYHGELTNRWCIEKCRHENYQYAGTQYRTQCFCGNSTFAQFLKYGTASQKECNTPCSGDRDEMCGGDWKLSVYQTKGRETWVGGTDFEAEGDWLWFPARRPVTYTHWLPGEPNNQVHPGFDREHCMALFPNQAEDGKYMWNDEVCHKQLHFVCEMAPLDIA